MPKMQPEKVQVSDNGYKIEIIRDGFCLGFADGDEEGLGPVCFYPFCEKQYLIPAFGGGQIAELDLISDGILKGATNEILAKLKNELTEILEKNSKKIKISNVSGFDGFEVKRGVIHQSKGIGPAAWLAYPSYQPNLILEVHNVNMFEYADSP